MTSLRQMKLSRLRGLAAQLSSYSTSTSTPLIITAEIARDISLRGTKLTQVPSNVAAAIEAAAADANRKAIRQKGRQLTDDLKRMSRTKHRGGIHPNFYDEPLSFSVSRPLRGKRRQKENKALSDLTQHAPILAESHEILPDSFWDGEEQQVTNLLEAITSEAKTVHAAESAAGGALYGEDIALAYAVTRLPACYASLHRILREIQRTAPPEWRPGSILDFGAGPGTASWAAHEVWSRAGTEPLQITAVEPSGAMAWMGQEIQDNLNAAYAAQQSAVNESDAQEVVPLCPPPVVRWMSRLSGFSSEKQVDKISRGKSNLIHGSSLGRKYDLVIAGYVLGEVPTDKQRRKLVKNLWNRTGKYLVLVEPGTPAGSERIQAARTQILSELTGSAEAHVAAPCPHDGPCPLQGQMSWCHFIQRFERTAVQRRAKVVTGKPPAKVHQDERFSYVVMAKGPREAGIEQVRVSGVFEPEEIVDPNEFLSIPAELKPKRAGLLEASSNAEREESAEMDYDAVEMEMRKMLWESIGGPDVEMDSDYDSENEDVERGSEDGAHSSSKNAQMMELPPELEEVLQKTMEDIRNKRSGRANSTELDSEGLQMSTSGSESDDDESTSDSELEESVDQGVGASGPEAETMAQRASLTWSRVLRTPRKRSGHVVLDLCSAVDAQGKSLGGNSGVLLRQIVSKGKATRELGGVAPYKLARKALWGDVWPLYYQTRMKAFEPPTTAETNLNE